MACIELEWWAYLSFVISFFVLCLCLNYVVKKINEAKIEERFIRMLQKASTTQSTQVNGPLIAVETAKTAQPSPPGISLVFNQEDNRRIDPYNMVLTSAKDKKFEVSSLNAYKSMEIINDISIPSDERIISDSIPIKTNEYECVATKATSFHILTEKVPVKNNEFGLRAVKEYSSITTKSDSYVTELNSVKNNEYGHVTGIGTLPVLRKDCNTSVLVSEDETGRIISRKSSPSIHIDNGIQDVTAKESAVRKESGHIKAEGITSNVPNDPKAENVPNARSIAEVAVKKTTVLGDKKSNESDSGCFIKKSVDSFLSKIANLTNRNEDLRREKSATDTHVAKQASSLTESSWNINEISYVEKKESSSIVTIEPSFYTQSGRKGENFTVKKRESGSIATKESSLHARIQRHGKDLFPVKMSITINAANATPSHTQSDISVSKNFPSIRSESRSIAARIMDPLLLQDASHARSDDNVVKLSVVSMSESNRISVKAKSLKNSEDTESDILVKKTETVIAKLADTSKTMNEAPVKDIPFTDKIKALLEDENIIDIMLYKPSSSTKK